MDTKKVNPYHKTDLRALKLNGTEITSTAAELNKLDGVVSTVSELDQYVLIGEIADISSSASSWIVAPYAGTIETIYTVIDGAITGGDAAITFEIATVAVTDGGITIANSSSAAGDVDSSTPSAANIVTAGQAIEILTNGGSTNAVKAVVTFVMQRS